MTPGPLWSVVGAADRLPAAARECLAERVQAIVRDDEGVVPVVTCHRVELYGSGTAPVERLLGPEAADVQPVILVGRAAADHLCRLAAGLESAVVGEEQVLHQVRRAFVGAAGRPLAADVGRAFELAIGVGRRARAGEADEGRDLGELGMRWLEGSVGPMAGRTVVVAGAGPMGRALAHGAARRGARVTVASRDRVHAERIAGEVGGSSTDLSAALELVPGADALAIALRGPWPGLQRFEDLPSTVDLSFPSVVPLEQRARLGGRFADVDAIFALGRADELETDRQAAYRIRAEALVAEAVGRYATWAAGRRSIETLRSLRERAEERRARELDRLLRRLPDLDQRERTLVEEFSEQLVAGLLHGPTSVLRDDTDGSADRAARHLFRL